MKAERVFICAAHTLRPNVLLYVALEVYAAAQCRNYHPSSVSL